MLHRYTCVDEYITYDIIVCIIIDLQSVCTFGYISVLSIVGERLATRLRSALFHSILQQVYVRVQCIKLFYFPFYNILCTGYEFL